MKCGTYAVETSSGLCKECASKASSFIYTPGGAVSVGERRQPPQPVDGLFQARRRLQCLWLLV